MFSDRPITQHPAIDALQNNVKYNTRKYLDAIKPVKELTDISYAISPTTYNRKFHVVFEDGYHTIYSVTYDSAWNVLTADYAAMKKAAA
jgi:hypothetical protein